MKKHLTRKSFVVDHLELRRLLSYAAYVQITSPLETTSGSNVITVATNQATTFNVSVTGYQIGGGNGPAPTGTVNIFETNTAGTVDRFAVLTLTGGTALPGGGGTVATGSGTLTLVSPGNVVNSDYQAYVYAQYTGDANYDDSSSAGSPPSNDGNVGDTVTVNFNQSPHIAFIQQPSNAAVGDTIAPPITVAVEDNTGAYETSATDSITLSLAGTSTGSGTLAGTATAAAVNGVATFSNLSINAGGNYTLTATDTTDSTTATSSSFDITAGKLVFLKPLATSQTADKPLTPTIQVELQDGSSNPITSQDGTVVTLALIGVNSANPITGTTAALSGGIATFSNVVLTKPGTYQLQASDPEGDSMATSNKFGVAGDTLKFLVPPKNGDLNTPISVKVEALTPKNKVDTTLDDSLQLGLNIMSGGTNAALSGMTTVALVNGIATFTTAAKVLIDAAGNYTLSATALNAGATDYTVTAATSHSFTIAPDHLLVKPQPTAQVDALDPIPLSIELVDSKGKVDTGENGDQVQLTLNRVIGPATANLGGTTIATSTAGVASFSGSAAPTIDTPGTYTLTAVESGLNTPSTSVISKSIKVGGYKLLVGIIGRQEPSATEDIPMDNATFTVNFLLRNSKGKSVTSIDGLPNVQLTLNSTSGNGTIEGTTQTSPTILGGGPVVYNFSGVAITAPGSYTITATAITTPGESIPASAISSATTVSFKTLPYQLIPTEVHETSPSPVLSGSSHDGGDVSLEDQALTTGVFLAVKRTAFIEDQTQVQVNEWVGVEISLINVPNAKYPAPTTPPVLSGTTVVPLTNAGVQFTDLSINAAGRYEFEFTEVISAANAPFNPAAFTPVTTTAPVMSEDFFIVPDAVVR